MSIEAVSDITYGGQSAFNGGGVSPKGLSVSFSGKPTASQFIGGGVAPYAFTLNAAASFFVSRVTFSSAATFIIQRNGAQIGTITFNAGTNAAAPSFSQTSIALGEVIDIIAPSTPDATGADIRGILREAV